MFKPKVLVLFISILFAHNISGQRMTANLKISDSLSLLKKGIYFSVDEFLNNQPGVLYDFELVSPDKNYYISPDENVVHFIHYYDEFGGLVELPMDAIWGFCDGKGLFISYENMPYEVISLGAISILRYEHIFYTKPVGQTVSLNVIGTALVSIHKINDAYLDLINKTVVPRKDKELFRIISNDTDLYVKYKSDRKTDKSHRAKLYFLLYNNRHPLTISQEGINIKR